MRVAAVLVGILIAASIMWFAAEKHYDNCLEAAKAEHLIGTRPSGDSGNIFGPPTGLAAYQRRVRERKRAIDGCSRTPW